MNLYVDFECSKCLIKDMLWKYEVVTHDYGEDGLFEQNMKIISECAMMIIMIN
jgi:hypothetical protein